MMYHDDLVGQMLDKLDELGIADNTIVMYSTDNGPHYNAWPDGAITPFRSEKNTNWEGAYRVPAFYRWPGHIPAGSVLNGIVTHQDALPTLLAAAGEPDIVEKCKQGYTIGDMTYKVCIDGFNMLDYFTGKSRTSARATTTSMSTTMPSWLRFATATGKPSSWSSARISCRSGWSRSSSSAFRSSSTCAATHSSGPISIPIPITTG